MDDSLFPEICVVCDECGAEVAIPSGLSAVEAAWMHEPDCAVWSERHSDSAADDHQHLSVDRPHGQLARRLAV